MKPSLWDQWSGFGGLGQTGTLACWQGDYCLDPPLWPGHKIHKNKKRRDKILLNFFPFKKRFKFRLGVSYVFIPVWSQGRTHNYESTNRLHSCAKDRTLNVSSVKMNSHCECRPDLFTCSSFNSMFISFFLTIFTASLMCDVGIFWVCNGKKKCVYQTKETKMTPRLHKLAKNDDNNMLSRNFMFSRDVVLPLDITPSGLQQDNISHSTIILKTN